MKINTKNYKYFGIFWWSKQDYHYLATLLLVTQLAEMESPAERLLSIPINAL